MHYRLEGRTFAGSAAWPSSRNRDGFMDRQYRRLLDFIEIGPGGNRERFLVVFWGFYILVRCVQSRDGKLVRVGSRALDS